jgi:hypothetical protein
MGPKTLVRSGRTGHDDRMTITTVYVPLDGSERAEAALQPATAIADRTGAELVLLSAASPDDHVESVDNYLSARIAFLEHRVRCWCSTATPPTRFAWPPPSRRR